jgi:hypothetical protein
MLLSTSAKYGRDRRYLHYVVMLWAGRSCVALRKIGSRRLHLRGIALRKIGSRRLNQPPQCRLNFA